MSQAACSRIANAAMVSRTTPLIPPLRQMTFRFVKIVKARVKVDEDGYHRNCSKQQGQDNSEKPIEFGADIWVGLILDGRMIRRKHSHSL